MPPTLFERTESRSRFVGPTFDLYLLQRAIFQSGKSQSFEQQDKISRHFAALSDRMRTAEFGRKFDRKYRRIRSKLETRRSLDSQDAPGSKPVCCSRLEVQVSEN